MNTTLGFSVASLAGIKGEQDRAITIRALTSFIQKLASCDEYV